MCVYDDLYMHYITIKRYVFELRYSLKTRTGGTTQNIGPLPAHTWVFVSYRFMCSYTKHFYIKLQFVQYAGAV